jgi:hypothetical protein
METGPPLDPVQDVSSKNPNPIERSFMENSCSLAIASAGASGSVAGNFCS